MLGVSLLFEFSIVLGHFENSYFASSSPLWLFTLLTLYVYVCTWECRVHSETQEVFSNVTNSQELFFLNFISRITKIYDNFFRSQPKATYCLRRAREVVLESRSCLCEVAVPLDEVGDGVLGAPAVHDLLRGVVRVVQQRPRHVAEVLAAAQAAHRLARLEDINARSTTVQ